mgnify:CR=1 FL=1
MRNFFDWKFERSVSDCFFPHSVSDRNNLHYTSKTRIYAHNKYQTECHTIVVPGPENKATCILWTLSERAWKWNVANWYEFPCSLSSLYNFPCHSDWLLLQMKRDSRMRKYKGCALFALVGVTLLVISSNMLEYYLAGGFSRLVFTVYQYHIKIDNSKYVLLIYLIKVAFDPIPLFLKFQNIPIAPYHFDFMRHWFYCPTQHSPLYT